ncbi:MAG: signal recognition particle-docking protein FtsY [Bacilli bacterium]
MGLFNKIKNIFNKEDKLNNEDVVKYEKGLEKTRNDFVSKLSILGMEHTKVNDSFFDELEEILIYADIGVNTTIEFIKKLKRRVKEEKITDFEYLKEVIIDELMMIYVGGEILSSKLNIVDGRMNVILFVGVNGVGKTTTIAKIAHKYVKEGRKILLIAGDTFRAGASSQLEKWSKNVGCMFYGNESKDPSSVIYDGLEYAKEIDADIVLIDTAGRLQNKQNLMDELSKINKVIGKVVEGAPHETLLVIDATTGQNGISQAKNFKEITNITGLVLTKLDGSSKGGIVLAIKESVNLPVKFVGLGEKEDDLLPFDIEKYIYGLFKEF